MPRVGLLVLCDHRHVNWAYKPQQIQECIAALQSAGLEVVYHPEVASWEHQTVAGVRSLQAQDVDCIIYYVTCFIEASTAVSAVQQSNLPAIVWSIPTVDQFTLIGMGVTHGSLDEVGLEHKFLYQPLNDATLAQIKSYASAAHAKRRLRGSRFCQIGGRCLGMYTGVADPSQWRRQFGIEVEHMDQYQLVLEAEKVPKKNVSEFVANLHQEFKEVEPQNVVLERSARMYHALKRIFAQGHFDFVGIKCQFELVDNYVAPCIAVSLLNDEGLVTACESDMNGALTMFVFHTLSGQPAFFADVAWMKDDLLVTFNCGTAATSFAESRKQIRLANHLIQIGSFDEETQQYRTKGGCCTNFVARAGTVTVARFARINGEYALHITLGETIPEPPDLGMGEFGKAILPWAYIKLKGNIDHFVQNLRSNHIHMVYGDLRSTLLDTCRLLGVRAITSQ